MTQTHAYIYTCYSKRGKDCVGFFKLNIMCQNKSKRPATQENRLGQPHESLKDWNSKMDPSFYHDMPHFLSVFGFPSRFHLFLIIGWDTLLNSSFPKALKISHWSVYLRAEVGREKINTANMLDVKMNNVRSAPIWFPKPRSPSCCKPGILVGLTLASETKREVHHVCTAENKMKNHRPPLAVH